MSTMAPAPPRHLIKSTPAADYLGISRHMLMILVEQERLTLIRIGRNRMFVIEELDEILSGVR